MNLMKGSQATLTRLSHTVSSVSCGTCSNGNEDFEHIALASSLYLNFHMVLRISPFANDTVPLGLFDSVSLDFSISVMANVSSLFLPRIGDYLVLSTELSPFVTFLVHSNSINSVFRSFHSLDSQESIWKFKKLRSQFQVCLGFF